MRQWKITEVLNKENLDWTIEKMRMFPLHREAGWKDHSEHEPFPFFFYCLVFSLIVFVWESYLNNRQLQRFNRKDHKTPLGIERTTFEKSLSYGADKLSFEMFQDTFMFAWSTILLLIGILPYAWEKTEEICVFFKLINASSSPFFVEWMRTAALIILFSLHDMIIGLPFSLYRTFSIEERHGFNNETLGLFLKDKVLTLFLTSVIATPIIGGVIWLSNTCGANFPGYVFAFLFCISLLMMSIYPTFIAPLFNSYEEMKDGELKTSIYKLAATCNFPLTQLFTVDGSRRSNHSNAFFYGFGKQKRIVLYDTLITQCSQPELLAILGHEIGHWALHHTLQGFVISQVYTFSLFLSFSYVQSSASLFSAFGFKFAESKSPLFVGLILFMQTYWGPVDKFLSFVLNMNSRYNEFAADKYSQGLGLGKDLIQGLIKISIKNLGNLVPDPLYSMYHFSHPPVIERVAALSEEAEAVKKTK